MFSGFVALIKIDVEDIEPWPPLREHRGLRMP
jgi:hypothetical protein